MPLTFLTILLVIILRISVSSRVLNTVLFSVFYNPLLLSPTQCGDRSHLVNTIQFLCQFSRSLLELFLLSKIRSFHSTPVSLFYDQKCHAFPTSTYYFHHVNDLFMKSPAICHALVQISLVTLGNASSNYCSHQN